MKFINTWLQFQKMFILINWMIQLTSLITYHSTIKMKPVDVKTNIYIDSSKNINDKDPKFEIGDIVRISKYKNIFAKG